MKVKIRGLVFAGFAAAVFAQSAMAAQTDDNTVTSKTYVDTKFQAQAKRVTSENIDTIVPSNDDVWNHDDLYPSMKVLKDNGVVDAQPKADTLVDEGVLEQNAAWIGWHNGDNNEQVDWVKLKGEGYTEIRHDASKGHLVKIVDSKIANTAAVIAGNDGQGPATTDFDDLTTAKAVYDVLTGAVGDGYQRKITTSEASALAGFNENTDAGEGVMIGHRATTGANTDSEWYVFGAKANGVDQSNSANNHLSYLYVAEDASESRKKFLISIKDGALAESGNAIITGGTASGAEAYLTRDKLTTAKAVYELLDVETVNGTTTISSSSGNDKVPTSKNVFDFVQSMMGGQNLPTMPDTCIAEGVHCALVSSYHAADATHAEPYAVLEWTVMAVTQ